MSSPWAVLTHPPCVAALASCPPAPPSPAQVVIFSNENLARLKNPGPIQSRIVQKTGRIAGFQNKAGVPIQVSGWKGGGGGGGQPGKQIGI